MEPEKTINDYLHGKFKDIDLTPLLQAAELLVQHDEALNALKILDLAPSYFRDNPTKEMLKLKDEINVRRTTSHWYQNCDCDTIHGLDVHKSALRSTIRGQLVEKEVVEFNDQGKTPFVVDFGSGEHWVAHALNAFGRKFTYKSISLNTKAEELMRKELSTLLRDKAPPGEPTIFVAGEVIEHLTDMTDIRQDFLRHCPNADILHISTPCYTFDPHSPWRTKDLGHIRCMTPFEFQKEVIGMFPEYNFNYLKHEIQHLRGTRKEKVQ